jgi:AraC-like DNA-binding protein
MISPQTSEYRNCLHRVLDYINDNLAEELHLESLADVAGFSPFHFHRIFSSMIGESPREYIERLRLERSANFLFMHPEKTITNIALECGFSSHAAFARSFKKNMLFRQGNSSSIAVILCSRRIYGIFITKALLTSWSQSKNYRRIIWRLPDACPDMVKE